MPWLWTALLLLSLAPGAQGEAAPSPAEAQRKYDSKDFHGAAGAYGGLAALEPGNAALHYNLRASLYKEGRLGPAIASFQRAFASNPRDPDIRYNLGFALRKAGEDLIPAGVPPLLFGAFHLLSERELAGLHWLACWAALLLSGLMLARPLSRKRALPWALASFGLWALCGTWWLSRRILEPRPLGVITRPIAEIRSGPGRNFGVSFTAPEGRRVQILSESGEWLEIGVLKEGVKGWLEAEAVERI